MDSGYEKRLMSSPYTTVSKFQIMFFNDYIQYSLTYKKFYFLVNQINQ